MVCALLRYCDHLDVPFTNYIKDQKENGILYTGTSPYRSGGSNSIYVFASWWGRLCLFLFRNSSNYRHHRRHVCDGIMISVLRSLPPSPLLFKAHSFYANIRPETHILCVYVCARHLICNQILSISIFVGQNQFNFFFRNSPISPTPLIPSFKIEMLCVHFGQVFVYLKTRPLATNGWLVARYRLSCSVVELYFCCCIMLLFIKDQHLLCNGNTNDTNQRTDLYIHLCMCFVIMCNVTAHIGKYIHLMGNVEWVSHNKLEICVR